MIKSNIIKPIFTFLLLTISNNYLNSMMLPKHKPFSFSRLNSDNLNSQLIRRDILDSDFKSIKKSLLNGTKLNNQHNKHSITPTILELALYDANLRVNDNDIIGSEVKMNILKLILENGANVNEKCSFDQSILESTLSHLNPQPQVIKLLLQYGANIYYVSTINGKSMLELAQQKDKIKDLVESYHALIQKVQNCPDKEVLQEAIIGDYFLLVQELIKIGIYVDQDDLELAKKYNSKKSGQILLNYLKLTSNKGIIAKNGIIGVYNCPEEVVENISRFLTEGSIKNYQEIEALAKIKPNKEILREAIKRDYYLIVESLIESGIIVDYQDLLLAKQYNSKNCGRLLIRHFQTIDLISAAYPPCGLLPAEITYEILRLSLQK